MRRYLVVANQTLGGPALVEAVRERLARGPCHFHVLVPSTVPADLLASGYTDAFLAAEGFIPPLPPEQDPSGQEEAERRLEAAVRRLRELGADVDGSVGDPDPMQAIRHALDGGNYDELILSTLPPGLSRWLAMDLPSRVQRRFDVPVTHVLAPTGND